MSKHSQPEILYSPHQVSLRGAKATLGHSRSHYGRVMFGAAIWLALLTSCSDDKPRRQQAEPPGATAPDESATANPAATAETSTAAGAGSRYQVVAGTAYFFDSPEPAVKPNGKYLLRGDVLYGEEERNGFVRTRFKAPNGSTVTGWLKREELGQLASATAPTRNPATAARPVAKAPVSDDYNYEETAAPAAPETPSPSAATNTQRAVVQVARSYFYDSPDLTQPRKAHCVQGDKVWLGEVRGDAVYVTFTNWEKVTSKGWMRRDALRPTP